MPQEERVQNVGYGGAASHLSSYCLGSQNQQFSRPSTSISQTRAPSCSPTGLSQREVLSNGVLLTTVSAGPVWPSVEQMEVAHSYGIRRSDGMYSRLVRADELPLNMRIELGIPDRQGPEGLILLPQPSRPIVPTHPIPIVSKAVGAQLLSQDVSNRLIGSCSSATHKLRSFFCTRSAICIRFRCGCNVTKVINTFANKH